MIRRLVLAVVLVPLALLAAALGYAGWLGWFGGPVYRLVPAAAAPLPAQAGLAAVFLSGDSGFNIGMAPRLMEGLAARGIPVLGVNTLTAFRHRRSPADIRALIAGAARRALALPGVSRVVLIGQSFGADMLQFGVADLPRDLRPRIALAVLAVPGDTLVFRATPGGFLDGAPDRPALPSARRIDWLPLVCIHGTSEPHSLCPLLTGRNVRIEALPGDHYLNHDAAGLTAAVWRAIRRD